MIFLFFVFYLLNMIIIQLIFIGQEWFILLYVCMFGSIFFGMFCIDIFLIVLLVNNIWNGCDIL